MAEKKKIKVVKQKRPKKPKKSKKARKAKKAKKGKKGKGQYSSAFPTNRQIDSNQYWQLRAEIAGAESRVRTSLKDRQEDEKKAEKKVTKLETEVKDFTKLSAAQQRQNFSPVGTPQDTRRSPGAGLAVQETDRSRPDFSGVSSLRGGLNFSEYDDTDRASASRASRSSASQMLVDTSSVSFADGESGAANAPSVTPPRGKTNARSPSPGSPSIAASAAADSEFDSGSLKANSRAARNIFQARDQLEQAERSHARLQSAHKKQKEAGSTVDAERTKASLELSSSHVQTLADQLKQDGVNFSSP